MAIIDKRVHRFAAFARKPIVFSIGSVPINQAGVHFARMVPMQGFPPGQPPYAIYGWRIERGEMFCTATVATATVDVIDISAFSGLLFGTAPVAGVVTSLPVVSPLTRKYTDGFILRITTNGTGTITNLMVTITIRPYPLADEAA